MRHVGLLAFGITTAVLVPAALHWVDAGSAQIDRLVAPGARALTLGGATIDVAVDRAIVDAGDTVHVTLTARQASDAKVAVAVLVMESVGSGGGRVETPPRRLARETVTFAAGAAGASKQLAFKLPGRRGLEMDGLAPFGHYTILVMAPKAADKLERLRHRAARVDNPMEDEGGRYNAWAAAYYAAGSADDDQADDAAAAAAPDPDAADDVPDPDAIAAAQAVAAVVGQPGETARLEVQTRPVGGTVALKVPDTARVGQPYTVVVTVRNPGKRAVSHAGVRLTAPPLYGVEYRGLAEDQLTIEPAVATFDLGPKQSRQVEFKVTAAAAGTAGVYAATTCDDSDDWETCHEILDGQLDATDIVAAEPTPAATTTAALPTPAAPPAIAAAPTPPPAIAAR